ncbi:MAG: leucine-rich repeat domain-containing protein [Bacteroidaceae bacterium]|nr:leucine-rich repeat domain-containing protein [Bacteroidaceae bacterium]
MKTYMIKTILLATALFSSSMAHAFDFFALNEDDVIIYYSILSSQERTVKVSRGAPQCYSDVVRIPERVSYNSVEFQVVGIDHNAFNMCFDLTSVEIPETVTSIGQSAFSNCHNLTTIKIPSGVTWIEPYTFTACYSLTSITIPDGVTSIRAGAFHYCTSLTSITIPDNVTSIKESAFENCSSLTHVTIGKSVMEMGYNVFNGCTALTEVTSRIENPFAIDNNCFPSRVKQSALLIVPKGTKAKYLSKRGWSNFYNIIEEGTGYYSLKLADNLQMFSYSENLDFSGCISLQVFVVCGFKPETSEVILMRVIKVPAGTGVLLRGETGNYYPSLSDQGSSIYSNFLVGNLTETSLTDGYVLKGDCFERVDVATAIPANSAYLTLPATAQGAKMLTLKFMEESTDDIDLVKDDMPQGNSHWYSLQGTRLNGTPTTPGIYIRNGRKVMVK